MRTRSAATVAVVGMVVSLLSAGAAVALGEPTPAAAAASSSQAWVTGVSAVTPGDAAGNGATRTLTFDTGVTATETTASVAGRCNPFGTGSAGADSVAAFLEPDPPAAARSADINCVGPSLGGGSRTAIVEFSKPVIAPVFHAANLDASRAGVSGTGITLTQLAKNDAMEVSGTTLNSTLQQALNAGCAGNDGSNPNGACGSFRLTSAGPVTAFTLANNTAGSTLPESGSNDSWSYTLSYPTAPLTKVFTPATIEAGATSALTFTIANPANPTQPTLTPLDFTDQLPIGVTLADDVVTSTPSCGSPTVNAAAGATSVTASGISVAAGATCEITVNVTSDIPGSYVNDTDNLSTSVANLIPNADTTLTVTEPPASPVPFRCVPGAPGTLFQQQPTDVYSVDLVTGASAQVGSDVFAGNLNAAGYNPMDDYMYAFDGTGSFYRIGSDWVPEPLGLPSNWTTFPVPSGLQSALNAGEFDAEGHLWVTNSNQISPYGWVEIDLSDPASPTYMQVVSAGAFSMPTGWRIGADWGYNVHDGDLYSLAFAPGTSPVRFALVRFDTDSHTVSLTRDIGTMQHTNGQYAAGFGAVYSDPDGFLYASDNGTGGIWRLDMATGASAFFAAGPASGLNDGARCFNSSLAIDFGDAPNSFGTALASDGPRHMIVDGTHLGATVDAEADGQPTAAADGDGADEDGVAFNPALGYPNATIRTGLDPNSQQPVQNTLAVDASADGFVSVWVDWNQDGDFLDPGEQVANAQAVTAGANDVTFSQATNPAGIQTYVRVRYSTDAASIATPTGAAPDGEVEDYRVLVERLVQPDSCVVSNSEYYAFTFGNRVSTTGTGGVGSSSRYADVSVINGVPVDLVIQSLEGAMNAGQMPPNGIGVGDGVNFDRDDAQWQINTVARLRYSFFEAGTSTPVEISAVFTANDMDGPNIESATFDASDLASYAVTEGSAVTITTSGGDVVFRGGKASFGDPGSRFQVAIEDKSTFEILWRGGNGSGFGFDGDGDLAIQPPACSDFGDAPNSYGTDLASNGPRHAITPGLTIGSQIDFDPNGQPTPGADGDDDDRIADEDAFSSRVILNPGVTDATLTVPVMNTTGGPATLFGWIDSNDNGRFEATEFASAPVPAGATSVDLVFASMPATIDGATPAIRLRLTSDALSDNAATPAVDERSLGAASNGEVEDHLAQVATLVPISCTDPFVEAFGTGGGYGPPLPAGQTTYTYVGGGVVNDGTYGLVSALPGAAGGWWHTGFDHTPGDTEGRLMLINADFTAGIFFQRTFTQLSPGATYDFSAWITNANSANSSIAPNVEFRVVDPTTGAVLASVDTGDIANKPSLVWERFALQFEATQSTVRLEVANNAPGGDGNDLAIDDISFSPVCEFGDAPDSYGTTIAAGGAGHIATGPTLGTARDTEPDGQPNTPATGDDATGTPNDEDGVATTITTSIGGTTTVTVTATNDSDAAVTLAAWLDLDGNGTFDAAERVLVTVPANSGTAAYDVSFPAISTTTDTYARFRVYGEPVADPQPIGTAAAGEVEDYLVIVNAPELEIRKTSDATADTRPGDVVTYTITAENTGAGDFTAANPAVVLDDLSGVLDDAAYNGDAMASSGPAPSYASPILSWVGELDSGDAVTLTYSVTLAAGGDGVVRNVAFGPGCDPADPDCDTTTPACDPPVGGADPATGIPCAETELLLPRLTLAKVADTTDLPVDGGVVRYTLTVTNTGPGVFTAAAPGSLTDDLSAVLDDATFNDDASADVGAAAFDATSGSLAWEGALGVGEVATITYSVTYDSSAGDHRLVNVACLPAGLAADPADPCRSVQIPGSALQDRKSVNPASGTAVVAGQQVTYTLYFENTGLADATVDTFDDLSDVLDDATLTGGPTASNPALTAVVTGTQLDVDGTVPTGQTYTVTYTVTVNPFAQQDDHVLGNVLGGDAGCPPEDPTCRTENPVRHLSVTKSSDAAADVNTGDTITYTVTVRNDGAADYTDDAPAIARDDLSGVLDDAAYNGDASASAGAVTYSEPILTWTGPLAVDETETFTYSVTVANRGDHSLENAAGAVCTSPEICDPPVVVVTPLPHVVPSKSSDPASGEDLNAGDVVTYVLSWTNDGEAAGVVDATDDLSDVLDDADVTSEPVASDPAISAVRTSDELRVTGSIQPGQTVTVTYSVTIRPDGERGDNLAANVLTPDVPPHACEDGDADCEPFVPPTTTHPIGELDDWKLVDPASGGTVRPGQEVTYTLHFENTGEADVAVDREDVLTRVLDDATVTSEPASSDPALSVSPVTGDRFAVTGTLAPGQHVTVTYTVTVRPDGERGDDRLGNALVPAGTEPDENCAPADPQRPDCTINHVSNVIASKSADPASGAEVGEGRRVTYTLTFENVSTNPDAADVAIDYTDHLVDVLDDAAVTTGPASSDAGVTGVRDGDSIRVTGAIASGDVVTVTYSVTVKPYDQQGDHRLGNVIAVTGEEPLCAPDSPLCTVHDLLPPPPPLAITGGTIGGTAVIGALLLLLAGGGALLISRRRRATAG